MSVMDPKSNKKSDSLDPNDNITGWLHKDLVMNSLKHSG